MSRWVIVCVAVSVGWGQMLIPPGTQQHRELERIFREAGSGGLSCEVIALRAQMTYEFQNWSGYDLSLPIAQFAQPEQRKMLGLALRVQPVGVNREAIYLYSRIGFPQDVPEELWRQKKVRMNLGGGFLVGEGKYELKLLLTDATGRQCTKSWKLRVPKRKTPARLGPGEVADAGLDEWAGMRGGEGKVTVYVHAAPLVRRRVTTRLSGWDRAVLLGSLRSLLENGGFAAARVKVFDLEGRRVIFEREEFGPKEYEELARELMQLDLGTVSVQTLQGPSAADFLAGMIEEEVAAEKLGETVLILGPLGRFGPKLGPRVKEVREKMPRTYLVSLMPWFSTATDLLERFVKAGGRGKVLTVHHPEDLAKVIKTIRSREE
jgi:hypothetical protein